jgi:hypothetical protein
MPAETYFVPTDANGHQWVGDDEVVWSLPMRSPEGRVEPGDPVSPDIGSPVVLLDLDGLLDDLGERIFVAEAVEAASPAQAARLLRETNWSLHEAARFALDCAEHVVAEPESLKLPSGPTLADVFRAARRYLDRDEKATADGLLERMSRLALARRLRRLGDHVADLAFQITVEDEAADLEAMDDPGWTATAAARDAVLSATEAIRHDAFPRLFESQNRRYEADVAVDLPSEVVSTPWGNFTAGNRAGVVPAWVAARDAAERARQAITDANGAEAGAAERAWQRQRLAEALGVA